MLNDPGGERATVLLPETGVSLSATSNANITVSAQFL
jgi:hypothetical protein